MWVLEDKVRSIAEQLLTTSGATKKNSEIVVNTLICADQRGIHTHGVGKIGDYLDRVTARVLVPNVQPIVTDRSCVAINVDAQNGFGQVAAYYGMERSIEKAQNNGVGLAVVSHSNHFGIASYYAMMAAKQQMIGISVTNASPGIAPFGAKEVLYGTNPLSIAIPSKTMFPIVLDMSSSVVARGKIRQAIMAEKELPLGWARDRNGAPTTDAKEALKGSLEPIAGPKGSGLALMIEILCGVLSSGSMPGEVRVIKDTSAPCGTSHFLMAIDPSFFVGKEEFLARIDQTIQTVKQLTPVGDAVYLPGEIEAIRQQKCRDNRLDLPQSAINALNELSRGALGQAIE